MIIIKMFNGERKDKYLPGMREPMESNPMSGSLSLRQVAGFTSGMISQTALAAIDEALAILNDGTLTLAKQAKVDKYRAMLEADRKTQKLPKPETGSYTAIHPGQPWLDTSGQRIQAHGGAVYYEDGYYYWR